MPERTLEQSTQRRRETFIKGPSKKIVVAQWESPSHCGRSYHKASEKTSAENWD